MLEVETTYEVFAADVVRLGTIRQIGQATTRRFFRIVTALDQYFTHHFETEDADGNVVLRLTRPRKLFKTNLHVFDADNQFVGTIRQRNMFWKIYFEIVDASGSPIGTLRAMNLRAWDFEVVDTSGRRTASIFKSWEGWAQTAFTRADRYAVRIDRPLHEPLRTVTLATALAVDIALKQDARGIG